MNNIDKFFDNFLLGLEKSKLPGRGRGGGLGRLSPALSSARKALVRGRGSSNREKVLPEVGIQEREKGIFIS